MSFKIEGINFLLQCPSIVELYRNRETKSHENNEKQSAKNVFQLLTYFGNLTN